VGTREDADRVGPAGDDAASIAPAPRSLVTRWCWTVAAAVVMTVPYWALVGFFPPDGQRPSPLATCVAALPAAAVLGVLGDRVSYHWSDAILGAMGPVGLFFAVKVVWRATLLPYRNWPARDDEVGDWRRVRGSGGRLWLREPVSAALPSLTTLTSATTLRRGLRAGVIVVAGVVPFVLVAAWAAGRLPGDSRVADWAPLVVPAGVTALIAPLASYRARDALAWIIPPFGLVLLARLAWRVAGR
jgi:hypothetical protein